MTSGNIRMGPDPDRIMEALEVALRDDPKMRERPAGEVAEELVRGGYLGEAPDPVLVHAESASEMTTMAGRNRERS